MISGDYTWDLPYRAVVLGEPARPFADVCLEHAADRVFTIGLIDSGADTSLFSAQYAQFLGITLEAGERGSTLGVGGSYHYMGA